MRVQRTSPADGLDGWVYNSGWHSGGAALLPSSEGTSVTVLAGDLAGGSAGEGRAAVPHPVDSPWCS